VCFIAITLDLGRSRSVYAVKTGDLVRDLWY
jgi:hypothetical protein